MSLTSNAFLLMVVAAVILYYIVPRKAQWIVLLVFSYVYYVSGGAKFLFFILYSTVVTYIFGMLIDRMHEQGRDQKVVQRVMLTGLIANLGMLGIVKYLNFFIDNFNLLFRVDINNLEMILPLGISFFTFQSSGYLLDVYWKRIGAEKNPLRYALFISFFPQILQGPIGTWKTLGTQLFVPHKLEANNIVRGLERIIWGFAKKLIIADWSAVFVDAIWGDLDTYNGLALLGLVLYGIQLYCDFSGAMDVVIGVGNLFGINMDENFRRPYLATSLADFWKRWHMTLGRWMENYVFYPISLSKWNMKFFAWSKKKFGRKLGRVIPIAVADIIVFFLVGIWHGASWKYVMYGLLNGGIIAFSELMGGNYKKWKSALHIKGTEKWYVLFMIVRTYILVNLRWFFDRSDDLRQGFYMIRQACTHFDWSQIMMIPAGSGGTDFVPKALLIIAVGTIAMVIVGCIQEKGIPIRKTLNALPIPVTVIIYMLILVAIGMFGCTAAPRGFIYAQF